MEEWGKVLTVAGGGFGVTIFVLVILSLVAWIMGLVLQKISAGDKEDSQKGK